jgi:hypothetical protein
VDSLDAAIQGVKREEAELDRALVERSTEAARLSRLTRATSLLLEALFLFADQEEIFQKAANRSQDAT